MLAHYEDRIVQLEAEVVNLKNRVVELEDASRVIQGLGNVFRAISGLFEEVVKIGMKYQSDFTNDVLAKMKWNRLPLSWSELND